MATQPPSADDDWPELDDQPELELDLGIEPAPTRPARTRPTWLTGEP